MSTTSSELASIEAQLALQRAALADKIFARFDQSTSSPSPKKAVASASSPSSSSKRKNEDTSAKKSGLAIANSAPPFEHRSPTLGLGATTQQRELEGSGVSRHLSSEDARLRGRLKSSKQIRESSGKRKAGVEGEDGDDDDDDDDEEESKAARLTKATKTKADPFAVKTPKVSRRDAGESPEAAHTTAVTNGGSSLVPPPPTISDGRLHTPPPGEESKLSKNQRKKLNKRRRLEQEMKGENVDVNNKDTSAPAPKDAVEGPPSKTSGSTSGAPDNPPTASPTEMSESKGHPSGSKSSFQPSAILPSSSAEPTSTLSLHQKALHSKIQGSHFRQLNESLYTSQSSDSFRLAQEDPSRMQAYHEGFREQVKKWPQKPYEKIGDVIAGEMIAQWEQLLSSGISKASTSAKASKSAARGDLAGSIPPGALIADLGAGEGPLTRYLLSHPKLLASKGGLPPSLMPRVLAYDLLDTADGIVRGADCAQSGGVPLPGRIGGGIRERISQLEQRREPHNGSDRSSAEAGTVDVVVFCLSLMGTDWVGMILEARRILKNGGQILIAEVASRFVDPSTEQFSKLIVRLGFKLAGKEAEREDNKKENSHFVLLRYAKLLDEEILATSVTAKKSGSNGIVSRSSQPSPDGSVESEEEMLIMDARELDDKEEKRLRSEGQNILKPCLYKRR